MKALIDGHDNPDTANAGISKIIKRYKADEGTELTCKQLCNVATSTKSYVILDWPLRQKKYNNMLDSFGGANPSHL